MNASTYHAHAASIKGYSNYMSVDSAIAKHRRSTLGRVDFIIDQVVEAMKKKGDLK